MQRPEGRFRRQRHPLCPECKYNLIATVEAHHFTCPECGYEFELDELSQTKRQGEWTLAIGLRRALVFLLLRSLVLIPLYAGLFWAIEPLLAYLPMSIGMFGMMGLLLGIPGGIIGHVLSKRLSEVAGFQSLLLGALACFFALGVIIGSINLVGYVRPFSGWHGTMTILSTSLFAMAWITRNTLLDD